jgi:two-component system CheB/CheR fusion protein
MATPTASNDAQAREVPHSGPSLVVGIGASAGGIAALKAFFGAASPSTGMAYVVILHLSPDHESSLAEVLQATTKLPVSQVKSRVRMAPDHVYVVPPNRKLTLSDGHIDVSEVVGTEERRAPIDIFLRTLADAQQERAVSVILSGTGADGSMGLKRVKERGGICLVQEPSEAEFSDMPRSAIATGLIDFVIPVARMPGRLAAYRQQLGSVSLPLAEDSEKPQPILVDIFTQLRARTGHDFTLYKRSTVLRRIERRMNVQGASSLAEYAARIRENREEGQALLKDLLISVTNFFRDPEAFANLATDVIPQLFAGKGANDHVRAWVAGCATGEEAY